MPKQSTVITLPATALTNDHRRYDIKSRLPGNWVTVKAASQLTGKSITCIHQAIHKRKIDTIRAGQGGWAGDRRYHTEVRLESVYDYFATARRGRPSK